MKPLFEDPKELDLVERVSLLLNEKGIKSMTMDDIATDLHVSKKTLYKYVKNRSELVTKCIKLRIRREEENREMIAAAGFNAIEEHFKTIEYTSTVISKTNPTLHHDLEKYFKEAWAVIVDFQQNFLLNSIIRNIKKGQQEGLYCNNVDPRIIARMYIAKIDLVFDGVTFPKEEFAFEKVLVTILSHHLRGMATMKGIEVLEKFTGIKYK